MAPRMDSTSAAPSTAKAPPSRQAGFAALTLLSILVLGSVALEARIWLRAGLGHEYADASAWVRKDWQPGDTFTVAPAWALRPLEELGDLRGMGVTAARAGLVFGTTRLWVVADADAEEDLRMLAQRFTLEEQRAFGPLSVVRFRVAPQPMAGAVADLRSAEVKLVKARGDAVTCSQPAGRLAGFTCPGEPDWLRTTSEWLDTGGVPSGGDLALWMHPPPRGDRKEVRLPNVTMGSALRVGGSHTEYGARSARAPVQVRVSVGGQVLLDRAWPVHHGWTVEDVAIPAELRAGPQDVVFSVETQDNAANHFAMDVGVLP